MKPRPLYFLSEEHIDHDSEPFDYITELHDYLWRFVRCVNGPECSGNLHWYLDDAIDRLEKERGR
jgi:hypothetical protein